VVFGGIVGGGVVVTDVEGGAVGGGIVGMVNVGNVMVDCGVVVTEVDGGIVGGGVVVTLVGNVGNVGKVGKSGKPVVGAWTAGEPPVDGMVAEGTDVDVWAPADDIMSPTLPAPTATSTATRRFQTFIPDLPFRTDKSGLNVAPPYHGA
jgi:hypothetical protein